jgi:long-subunit acyl-CoA synthetase (AMP-forming)
MLGKFGAPQNVIFPGFGMTETCAGSIYSSEYPDSDLSAKREFVSMGKCVPGIHVRISSLTGDRSLARVNEPGCLEVNGPIVFKGYYNMEAAAAESFTQRIGGSKRGTLE